MKNGRQNLRKTIAIALTTFGLASGTLANSCSHLILSGHYFPAGISVPFGANGFAIGRYDRPLGERLRKLLSIQVGYGTGRTRFVVSLRNDESNGPIGDSGNDRYVAKLPGCDLLASNTAFALYPTGKSLLLWCRKTKGPQTFVYNILLRQNSVEHIRLQGPEISLQSHLVAPTISPSGKKAAIFSNNSLSFFSTDPFEKLFSLELGDGSDPQIVENLQFDDVENIAAVKTHSVRNASAKKLYLVSLSSETNRSVLMDLGTKHLGVYGFYWEPERTSGLLVDLGQSGVRRFPSVGSEQGVLYRNPKSYLLDNGVNHLYARTDSDFLYPVTSKDPRYTTLQPLNLHFQWNKDTRLVFPKDEILVDMLSNQTYFLTLKSEKVGGPLDTVFIRKAGDDAPPVAAISANDRDLFSPWAGENEFSMSSVRFLGERTVLLCPKEGTCVISNFTEALSGR